MFLTWSGNDNIHTTRLQYFAATNVSLYAHTQRSVDVARAVYSDQGTWIQSTQSWTNSTFWNIICSYRIQTDIKPAGRLRKEHLVKRSRKQNRLIFCILQKI